MQRRHPTFHASVHAAVLAPVHDSSPQPGNRRSGANRCHSLTMREKSGSTANWSILRSYRIVLQNWDNGAHATNRDLAIEIRTAPAGSRKPLPSLRIGEPSHERIPVSGIWSGRRYALAPRVSALPALREHPRGHRPDQSVLRPTAPTSWIFVLGTSRVARQSVTFTSPGSTNSKPANSSSTASSSRKYTQGNPVCSLIL